MYVTGQRPASAHLYLEVFRIASDAFFGRCANRTDCNRSKEIELNAAGAVGGNWQIALHSIKKRVSYKRKRPDFQFGVSPPRIAAARERGSVILVEIVDLLHGRLARGAQAPAPGAGAFLSAPFCRRHSSQLDGERAGVILVDMS